MPRSRKKKKKILLKAVATRGTVTLERIRPVANRKGEAGMARQSKKKNSAVAPRKRVAAPKKLAAAKQAAMHPGMQRLYPPLQNFGKSGEAGDVPNRNLVLAQEFGRSAGGNDIHSLPFQFSGKRGNAFFVRNGNERPGDLHATRKPIRGLRGWR